MNSNDLKNLAKLTLLARGLTGADVGDAKNCSEYARGQAELILDFCDITSLYDENKDIVDEMVCGENFLMPTRENMDSCLELQHEYLEKIPSLSNKEAWVLACIHPNEFLVNEEAESHLSILR